MLAASADATMESLASLGIRYLPTSEQAAIRAGAHAAALSPSAAAGRERVVADFLIGAHALLQCGALITRDAGFFRDYFKGLQRHRAASR